MRIAVDAMGGDLAPVETVKGAIAAAREYGIEIVLVGDVMAIKTEVAKDVGGVGLTIEPVTYPDGTRTADDAARAIGCDVAQIVKSLVFDLVHGDEVRPVMALVSGANRLDATAVIKLFRD